MKTTDVQNLVQIQGVVLTPRAIEVMNAMQRPEKTMKKLLLLIAIVMASCAIKPVCNPNEGWLVITGYSKFNGISTAESVNHNCFASFKIEGKAATGDTVMVEYIRYGSVATNFVATVRIIAKK
jgi:hypothetical protein